MSHITSFKELSVDAQPTYVHTSNVRTQIQSLVSNKLNNASCPPTAKNLLHSAAALERVESRDVPTERIEREREKTGGMAY